MIIGLKLKIRLISSETMLKHDCIYKRCLMTFDKSCLKRMKLSINIIGRFTEKVTMTYFFICPLRGGGGRAEGTCPLQVKNIFYALPPDFFFTCSLTYLCSIIFLSNSKIDKL